MKKIRRFFDREQNLLIHIIATICVTIFGIILHISFNEWLLVYFLVAFVITSELINSSIELAVDLVTEEYHPLAKVAKDTASAACFIADMMAAGMWLVVFVPKIMALFR